MVEVHNLEIHAWHACNLFCESCSHYSSLGLRGGPSAEECESWMSAWGTRIAPRVFSIVGGEPTLNPDLTQIVIAAGKIWHTSRIRLVTNGLLLSRHPDLPKALAAIGRKSYLEISSHHTSPEFQARFADVREIAAAWKNEYGLNIRIINSEAYWIRSYDYAQGAIRFMDGDPRRAWEACEGKKCRQIFDGNLWKCPAVAYFNLMKQRTSVDARWDDLLKEYRSLEPSCTDAELADFMALEEEMICKICPESLERFKLPNPLYNIRRSKGSQVEPGFTPPLTL